MQIETKLNIRLTGDTDTVNMILLLIRDSDSNMGHCMWHDWLDMWTIYL